MGLIPAQSYYSVYLIITVLLSLTCFSQYARRDGGDIIDRQQMKGGAICLFMILFIGTRPISDFFGDMPLYYGLYTRGINSYEWSWSTDNVIFDNLIQLFAYLKIPPTLFYILVAAFYFGCMWKACSRLFPHDSLAAFIVCLGAFSTFSYGTNGIKAGAAAAMFMLALSYRDRLKVCILLMIISYGLHHAMQLPLIAFVCTLFYRNTKFFLYFWFVCLFMAILHISYFQTLFAGLTDKQGAEYLAGGNFGGRGGLRIDFILYSFAPVVMLWYATKRMQVKSLFYDSIASIYLFTNGIWLLCMYANFTNRIAYLSWCIYPIVLIYPILNEKWQGNRYKAFSKIAWAHLAFTLFIQFLYISVINFFNY